MCNLIAEYGIEAMDGFFSPSIHHPKLKIAPPKYFASAPQKAFSSIPATIFGIYSTLSFAAKNDAKYPKMLAETRQTFAEISELHLQMIVSQNKGSQNFPGIKSFCG